MRGGLMWAGMLACLCASLFACAAQAAEALTPEEALIAFADAVDMADLAGAHELCVRDRVSDEIVAHLIDYSRTTLDAEELVQSRFGRSADLHGSGILAHVDDLRRQKTAEVHGDVAKFTVDNGRTVRAVLRQVDGAWRLEPASLLGGKLAGVIPTSRCFLAGVKAMLEGIKSGKDESWDSAEAHLTLTYYEAVDEALRADPLPPPDLSSPQTALVEFRAALQGGSVPRLLEVAVLDEHFRNSVVERRARAEADQALAIVVLKRLGSQAAKPFRRRPSAIFTGSDWSEALAEAKQWASDLEITVDGEQATVSAKPDKTQLLALRREQGQWKVVYLKGSEKANDFDEDAAYCRMMAKDDRELAAEIEAGRIKDESELKQAMQKRSEALFKEVEKMRLAK